MRMARCWRVGSKWGDGPAIHTSTGSERGFGLDVDRHREANVVCAKIEIRERTLLLLRLNSVMRLVSRSVVVKPQITIQLSAIIERNLNDMLLWLLLLNMVILNWKWGRLMMNRGSVNLLM